MRSKRLLWQLYPLFLGVLFSTVLVIAWYATQVFRDFYLAELRVELEGTTRFITAELLADGRSGLTSNLAEASANQLYIEKRLKELATGLDFDRGLRMTVILPSGAVLADTSADPLLMENHLGRPEVQQALSGQVGMATRFSSTVEHELLYVAVPVFQNANLYLIVRAGLPLTGINTVLHSTSWRIILCGILTALIAAALSFGFSRFFSRPLEEIQRDVKRLARGELSHRVSGKYAAEYGELAKSINHMAEQLEERIQVIVQQQNEQQLVLASMVEGVLAVNAEGRIISLNQAGAELLGTTLPRALGRPIEEVLRNYDLQKFIAGVFSSSDPLQGDIVIHSAGERLLHANGSPLLNNRGEKIGALVVFNDITRVRRLENIRRDFVANVSHEIKTPITSIKGFVETLLDGALKNPEEAQRFLTIIARHVDRLTNIIDDLLALSRIEEGSESQQIELWEGEVQAVLEAAIEICEGKAAEKNIKVQLESDISCSAKINPNLLEQAVVNLIDNAIKYSDEGSSVSVQARRRMGEVLITVSDEGSGISEDHVPRLFERFYRVDKARSRKVGGTGLGLAIVKHVALAHRGTVSVESEPGKGSAFTIHLPETHLDTH